MIVWTAGTAEGYFMASLRAADVIFTMSFMSSIASGFSTGGAGEAPADGSIEGAEEAPASNDPALED